MLLQKAIVAELLGTLLFQFMVGFSKDDALAAGVSYAVLRASLTSRHLNCVMSRLLWFTYALAVREWPEQSRR